MSLNYPVNDKRNSELYVRLQGLGRRTREGGLWRSAGGI